MIIFMHAIHVATGNINYLVKSYKDMMKSLKCLIIFVYFFLHIFKIPKLIPI